MLFNSYEFILYFLPLSVIVYFILNKYKLIQLSKAWIVLMSLIFYSWWNIKYLPLILISMLFNYAIGSTLNNSDNESLKINRKAVLVFGISANLLLLGYYKYFDFFITNTNSLFGTSFPLLNIILPLGISFFTFTQITYLVDAYRKVVKELDLLNYALFVTFFPHLIAGPILHHKDMMPQFASLKNKILNYKNISTGIFLFVVGLVKKVIIADALASLVHTGFDLYHPLTFVEAWLVSLSYTLQLYFDFSGYTDMALGAALMLNIKLPINFNSPYQAVNIQDFWRRWHITLGNFLKNYVYIPLGGNRNGTFNTYKNLFITFVICGIWHGAGWLYITWGALHGAAIVINRAWQKLGIKLPKVIAWFLTFNFVNIAWVIFRAPSFSAAKLILKGMFGFNGMIIPKIYHGELRFDGSFDWRYYTMTVIIMIIAFLVVLIAKNSNYLASKFKPTATYAIILSFIFCWILFNMSKVSEFLYFNF